MSVREELQAIYDKHGLLTADLVVQEARPQSHPLHSRVFDRPVAEAAEAWYRDRAQDLIRSVKVVYREATEDEAERSVREWQSVRTERGDHYEPVRKVVEDDFLFQLKLRDMEREWRQLYERYGHFEEFATLVRGALAL